MLTGSLTEYEQFLSNERVNVSDLEWTSVVKRVGFSAYRKRRAISRESDSYKVHSIHACGVVGELKGAVEGVMLGSVHVSDDFTSALEDYLYKSSELGSALLCSIAESILEAPDRIVRIIWDMLGSQSSTLETVLKPRDYVMVVATDTTIKSTGERIGYRLFPLSRHRKCTASASRYPRNQKLHVLVSTVAPSQTHIYIVGCTDLGPVLTAVAARVACDALMDTVNASTTSQP